MLLKPQVLNANAGRGRQLVCRSCEAFGRLIGYNIMRTGTLRITPWIRLRRSLSKMEDGFEDFDATVKADWTGYKWNQVSIDELSPVWFAQTSLEMSLFISLLEPSFLLWCLAKGGPLWLDRSWWWQRTRHRSAAIGGPARLIDMIMTFPTTTSASQYSCRGGCCG